MRFASLIWPFSNRSKRTMERVRVLPGRLPPSMRTTPNSPTVWAKVRTAEVRMPFFASGRAMRTKAIAGEAPRVAAASSRRWSTPRSAATSGWTAKGRL